MKILNLYAGIGGNRKLWGDEHDIIAIELNPQIAKIYQDFFPNDKVIVADAHQYLLEHFKEFEFIWSSPPCPTHSRINIGVMGVESKFTSGNPYKYPDMTLYQEIVLLKHHFEGKYTVENVVSYYEPLYPPQEVDNHYFWTNFHIMAFPKGCREHYGKIDKLQENKGFDLSGYKGIDKIKILRNCVKPELGLHILNESKRNIHPELFEGL